MQDLATLSPEHVVEVVLREGAHAVGAPLQPHAVHVQQLLQAGADAEDRPVHRRQVDLRAVPCRAYARASVFQVGTCEIPCVIFLEKSAKLSTFSYLCKWGS